VTHHLLSLILKVTLPELLRCAAVQRLVGTECIIYLPPVQQVASWLRRARPVLQALQVIRVIPLLPTGEGLRRDAKIATGNALS